MKEEGPWRDLEIRASPKVGGGAETSFCPPSLESRGASVPLAPPCSYAYGGDAPEHGCALPGQSADEGGGGVLRRESFGPLVSSGAFSCTLNLQRDVFSIGFPRANHKMQPFHHVDLHHILTASVHELV